MKQHCAVCDERFEESELLFHDLGRVCESCELDLKEESDRTRGVWLTVIGGPLTAITGSVMLCVPIAGGTATGSGPWTFFMLGFAALALWRGTVALQLYWEARGEGGLPSHQRMMLLLSGAVTVPWSLVLAIVGGSGAMLALWGLLEGAA
jgi:hypothetical protein